MLRRQSEAVHNSGGKKGIKQVFLQSAGWPDQKSLSGSCGVHNQHRITKAPRGGASESSSIHYSAWPGTPHDRHKRAISLIEWREECDKKLRNYQSTTRLRCNQRHGTLAVITANITNRALTLLGSNGWSTWTNRRLYRQVDPSCLSMSASANLPSNN
jgi:hypothetical protein